MSTPSGVAPTPRHGWGAADTPQTTDDATPRADQAVAGDAARPQRRAAPSVALLWPAPKPVAPLVTEPTPTGLPPDLPPIFRDDTQAAQDVDAPPADPVAADLPPHELSEMPPPDDLSALPAPFVELFQESASAPSADVRTPNAGAPAVPWPVTGGQPGPFVPVAPGRPATGRVGFLGVLRAEAIKLFSLRSTWWVLGVTLMVTVGLGALVQYSMRILAGMPQLIEQSGMGSMTIKATAAATQSYILAELILAALAVLVATHEYSSGQIRSTLTAVPTRIMVLAAKAAVVAGVTFVTGFVTYYLTTIVSWMFLANLGKSATPIPPGWTLTDNRFTGDGLRTIAGMALATALVALFALAAGMMTRNTAAAIVVVVIVLLVLSQLLGALGTVAHWIAHIQPYLLDGSQIGLSQPAGTSVDAAGSTVSTGGPFGFWKSLLVTGLWAGLPLVGAGVLLMQRDA